jgi:hypothetical protein
MRPSILCIFAAVLCAPCFAQTTTAADSQHLPSVPVIVAKMEIRNQTGAINPFTLYTPREDDDFRISAYMSSPSCAYSGVAFDTLVSWTDDSNTWTTQNLVYLDCNGGPQYLSGEMLIHVEAGTPISVQVYFAPGAHGSYSDYIVLERE